MTRDDILRMAAQAGLTVSKWDYVLDEVMDGDNHHIQTDQIIAFARLIAENEREALLAAMRGLYDLNALQRKETK